MKFEKVQVKYIQFFFFFFNWILLAQTKFDGEPYDLGLLQERNLADAKIDANVPQSIGRQRGSSRTTRQEARM